MSPLVWHFSLDFLARVRILAKFCSNLGDIGGLLRVYTTLGNGGQTFLCIDLHRGIFLECESSFNPVFKDIQDLLKLFRTVILRGATIL